MCGIAGIWQLDGQKVERNTVKRFIGALAHRGPDREGSNLLLTVKRPTSLKVRQVNLVVGKTREGTV